MIKPALFVRVVVGATESRATRLDTPPVWEQVPLYLVKHYIIRNNMEFAYQHLAILKLLLCKVSLCVTA